RDHIVAVQGNAGPYRRRLLPHILVGDTADLVGVHKLDHGLLESPNEPHQAIHLAGPDLACRHHRSHATEGSSGAGCLAPSFESTRTTSSAADKKSSVSASSEYAAECGVEITLGCATSAAF